MVVENAFPKINPSPVAKVARLRRIVRIHVVCASTCGREVGGGGSESRATDVTPPLDLLFLNFRVSTNVRTVSLHILVESGGFM